MAKGDELVKYITERVVTYVETPREIRKVQKAAAKEPWVTKWFGVIPFGFSMWWENTPVHRKRRSH